VPAELVAQGGANIAAVVFGGMPVTGTIARTADAFTWNTGPGWLLLDGGFLWVRRGAL